MDQPNFYAIIPASVRYDKRLKANEKLLYGEITSLANAKGYCYANNGYFAELYDVSIETVSRWISNLKKRGYIHIDMGENGENRKIYIESKIPNLEPDHLTKISNPLTETSSPLDEKVKPPLTKKSNIIINNNNIINIFDFWNSKNIIKHQKLTDELKNIIASAIKKYGVENIMLAIDRYSQAYFDSSFYYDNRWALANFLKQKNGISNWLDDGQIWNNYSPTTKQQGTSSISAVPDAEKTESYLDKIKKLRESGGQSGNG